MDMTKCSLLLLMGLLGLLTLTSCGATAVDLTKIKECSDLAPYIEKRIALEGYIGAHRKENLVICGAYKEKPFCLLSFATQPDAKSDLDVKLEVGNAPNHLKDQPTGDTTTLYDENRRRVSEALKFLTTDRQVIGTRDRVRVTGTYNSLCIVTVEKIEKL
jgi:hypothetical protein